MFIHQDTSDSAPAQPSPARHIQRDELPVAVVVVDPDRFCITDHSYYRDNPIRVGDTVTLIARPAGMVTTFSFVYQPANGDTLRGFVFEGGFAVAAQGK
jgi:hypothetical protein